jgi:hypothetical protein
MGDDESFEKQAMVKTSSFFSSTTTTLEKRSFPMCHCVKIDQPTL